MTHSHWTGRRVLVTGHTGFKGAWLAWWLHREGATVSGLSDGVPTVPSLYDEVRLDDVVTTYWGDVADGEAVTKAIAGSEAQDVFHLAAQPLVRASYADPVGTIRTNVLGTATVLDAVRNVPGVSTVVVVTTDKCYAEVGDRPYVEDDRLGGHDLYSSSKAAAELVAAAFRSSYAAVGMAPIATARAGNVIGGGDWAEDRLLPDAARAAASATPLVIRSPDAVRPWQHVLDCLAGYLRLSERLCEDPRMASAWNFGPDGREQTVGEVVQRAADRWDGRLQWQHQVEPGGPREAPVLRLDASRARRELGWAPRWDVDTAIDRTVDWYRAHADGVDARTLVDADLDAYLSTT